MIIQPACFVLFLYMASKVTLINASVVCPGTRIHFQHHSHDPSDSSAKRRAGNVFPLRFQRQASPFFQSTKARSY